MNFDTRAFRDALGTFATGVTVVTAGAEGGAIGITVSSFTPVSLDPPLVLWCLGRRSRCYTAFTTAANFTISVLAGGQRDIADRFAGPGEQKLDGVAVTATENGPPALAGALAVFECMREAVLDGGDHAVIVGRVLRFSRQASGAPLVFFRSRYAALAETE